MAPPSIRLGARMKFPKLRSTVLTASTIASLVLFPLWVHSFDRFDIIRGFGLEIRSGLGIIMCLGRDSPAGMRFSSQAVDDWRRSHRPFDSSLLVRGGARLGNHFWIAIPYWFPTAIATTCAAIAAIPWFGWRRSNLLLIIAMLLIAMGLGLSVYVLRK
jgi:hypothetical protein